MADDDFAAGGADPHLPPRYRQRLKAFAEGAWPKLKQAADIVIVPGAVLARTLRREGVDRAAGLASTARVAGAFLRDRRIDIAHLGTGSHVRISSRFPGPCRYSARASAKPGLRCSPARPGCARAETNKCVCAGRWHGGATGLTLPRMRFHLALYPLRDTPFNRARSANKLFEHALVGAASLMSPNPALVEAAGFSAEIFVEGDMAEWARRIETDLADRDALRRRAESNARADQRQRPARSGSEYLAQDPQVRVTVPYDQAAVRSFRAPPSARMPSTSAMCAGSPVRRISSASQRTWTSRTSTGMLFNPSACAIAVRCLPPR